jgi:predicted SprT family Zn-dependent metalloprotease
MRNRFQDLLAGVTADNIRQRYNRLKEAGVSYADSTTHALIPKTPRKVRNHFFGTLLHDLVHII